MKAIRRTLLSTASSIALISSAGAADLSYPVKARPVVAASWAGPYVGVNLGAAWNHAGFEDLGDNTSPPIQNRFPPGTFWSPSEAGFTIGGQLGYNWQAGNIVYGLEGDLNWVNAKTSATLQGFGPVIATTELDWFATVRGRIGVAFSPTLVYVTGGLALGHFKDAWGSVFRPFPEYSSDETRAGWTVGGGIEHMLTPNWTAKIEGLYADFGDAIAIGNTPANIGSYRSRFTHSVAIIRGGLNWKW
jgi:outer membrane immunogenic protein